MQNRFAEILGRKTFQFLGISHSIQRNALLSLVNQSASMIAALVSLPFLLKYLGTERVGLITIIWVIIGYFSVLDLGMSVAITRNAAFSLGAGCSKDIPRIFWSGIAAQFVLGLIGGGLIIATSPLIIFRFLNISPSLIAEAEVSFLICGLSFPFIVISSSFVGLLQAAQRFDLTARIQIPGGILQYLLPILVALKYPYLNYMVISILVARLGSSLFMFNYCLNVFPDLMRKRSFQLSELWKLLRFGGWITAGNLISPIVLYADRFMIGGLISMASVAYYSVPNEAVMKLTFIPGSIATALFPAFSSLSGKDDYENIANMTSRAIKYIFFIIAPVVLFMLIFSSDIIEIWIGPQFADKSTNVFRILIIGLLLNSIARVLYSQIQALGAAQVTGIIQIIELPIQLILVYLLVSRLGIVGAAVAWTGRIAFDLAVLYLFSRRLLSKSHMQPSKVAIG